ncbi:MAG: hypothetical protein LT082_08755 [Comamonas sp.]|nr:hypothetical protein [Comamonas sp.]
MPFYRTSMGMVHMRGTKLPAPCGARVLINGREQPCLAISAFLCDGPPPQQRQGVRSGSSTCDRALCAVHARETGPNRHLCPECHLALRAADPQRGLFTSLV